MSGASLARLGGWASGLVVTLGAAAGAVYAYGSTLPVGHVATVERELPATAATIYAVIATPQEAPEWRTGVRSVEILPSSDGRPRWREHGDEPLTLEMVDNDPPRRLVTRIVDHPDFGGTWTWELSPTDHGTLVKITEDGKVYHPLFRVALRHVIGESATLEATLDDLRAHLARREG